MSAYNIVPKKLHKAMKYFYFFSNQAFFLGVKVAKSVVMIQASSVSRACSTYAAFAFNSMAIERAFS